VVFLAVHPSTYRTAGLRRGTAASTSTSAGTTSGNAAGRLPRGKPDEGEPHVRFGKGEQETGRNHRACSLLHYRAIDQHGQVIDVLISEKRDLVATRRFFTRALEHGPSPIEVTTDHAAAYPRVLDELVPAACHVTEQYGNNPIESDHGRLKSRLRAMRGLKQLRCTRVITAGHAFIQNIRRGHYELGAEETVNLRVPAAFDELVMAI
jgi:transposase, IS6 family